MLDNTARPDGIIHDMRNLITVISLNSGVLDGSVATENASLVAGITQAANHLTTLLERLESNVRPVRSKSGVSDVNETLRQVVVFAHAINERVEFILPDTPIDLAIKVEPSELLRCVMNLAVNAAEAAAGNTRVRPVVEFQITRTPDHFSLHVLDSGGGFSVNPDDAFAPYTSSRLGQSTGRGLGLYVVKSIVDSWGGRVRVDRRLAQTEMSVDLPVELVIEESTTAAS